VGKAIDLFVISGEKLRFPVQSNTGVGLQSSEVTMSKPTVSLYAPPPALPVSRAAEVAGILLAALGGIVGGSIFGAVVARSLLVGIVAAIGGAVCGLIGAARFFDNDAN
jgi:hypothetical protein